MEEIKTEIEAVTENSVQDQETASEPSPTNTPAKTSKFKNPFSAIFNKELFNSKVIFNKGSIILSSCVAVLFILILILVTAGAHSKYNRLSSDYDSLSSEYNNLKFDTMFWTSLSSDEQQKIKDISDLDSEITNLKSDKSSLQTDISSLKSEKKKLQSDIITISGSPKTYPAGYLTAGTDFDAGRYKIYGGSSNFIVHSSDGDLRVNIILGNGSYYSVKEYIYTFSVGDEIQAESKFKMVLVK